MPQGSFKGFNKSKEELNNQLTDSDDLSKLKFKQKSTFN